MVYAPTFVITGPDELGLKYTSELLIKCGIPCGHQDFFNLALFHMMTEEFWGDASWFFAITEKFQEFYQSIIIIEQTRDTNELSKAMCKYECFTENSPFKLHLKSLFKEEWPEKLEDQVQFIIDKCKIESDYSFNVADMDSDLLAEIIKKIECPWKVTKETLWEATHTTIFDKEEHRETYTVPTSRVLAEHAV